MGAEDIELISRVIREREGCDCKHLKTVPIKEEFEGKTIWQGEVEVFEIAGHDRARFCYGWGYLEDGGKRMVHLIFGIPPVDSPQKAVQVFIANTEREQREQQKLGET